MRNMFEEKKIRETSDKKNVLNCLSLAEMSRVAKKHKLTHNSSRIKTVFYKYRRNNVKPADNTYCYSKRGIKSTSCHFFSVDRILIKPPFTFIEHYNEEVKQKVIASGKKFDSLSKNIVSLKDVVEGTLKESEEATALKKKELFVNKRSITKRRMIVRCIEAEIPKIVDEQLTELLTIVDNEQRQIFKFEDITKIISLRDSISDCHLEPFDHVNIKIAKTYIVDEMRRHKNFDKITKALESEIIDDYKQSLRSAIMNYVLTDSNKRKRLSIETLPIEFPVLCVRAPVPWHQSKVTANHMLEHSLFIGNEIFRDIRDLWFSKYRQMRIICMKDFGTLPIPATEVELRWNGLCAAATDVLIKEWLVDVAEIFLEKKHVWSQYFEMRPDASTALIKKYFRGINSLLSRQLRIMIMETLRDVRDFFMRYKAGNVFEGYYKDLMFLEHPFVILKVEPRFGTTELCITPNVLELHTMISRCFDKIIAVSANIPKIDSILFPELEHMGYLFSISRFEDEVMHIIGDVLDVVTKHIFGPTNYLKCYHDLLYITSGVAEKKLNNFFRLEPIPLLREFEQQIRAYDNLRREICMFRNKVSLNMIAIDCSIVNDAMRKILFTLRSTICDFFATELRANNRDLCSTFDKIADAISKMPETTQQVVELYNYLCESRDTTMFILKRQLARSIELTSFLFDYQPLLDEDIHLNTRAITWPKEMDNMMELAASRLNMRKEFLETVLRTRRDTFEKKIITVQLAIDQFKRKDPPVLTMEEMEQTVEEIEQISATMAQMRKEAEEINEEEGLLDMEVTPYTELPSMLSTVEIFDKLWHTALDFHRNYDRWFYGSFLGLDAEEVRENTENTWRLLYKLSRVLTDVPGARRVAEMVRGKVEKFRQFIPVLQVICTPGLQDRHWESISKIVDVQIVPTEISSLSEMVEYGLPAFIAKLEEIASAATKEYILQQNLQKMKEEWQEVYFELIPYRETGVFILTAVDDVQMLLDDHILKAQTMCSSPYVKAFEKEMQEWEEKLILMQDIIDQWLLCQATWMYLEPIFSSEDIMRQMPTESRNFFRIDEIWRKIMLYVLKNRRVTDATAMSNMLQELKLCNVLLEEIQKGLNEYLEKKRLFFPRFFFLSNDELLEMLSETKDPQRVQPHLRKCFEGISKLRFTKDEEIVGILSVEEEYVPLSGKIYPADAKGMVEKWLCQVENLMVISLRDIAEQSILAYFEEDREDWVLVWPGQIVICSSQVHWTSEVYECFSDNTLKTYLLKCNDQIENIVMLVRGLLSSGTRITLNALIVIDVHARDVVKLLIDEKTNNPSDFNWIAQLRYYWLDDCITVSMITTNVMYAFEYLGNTSRLVITPLTDRCYRTLMGALKMNLGGSPEGPAGTGKTETAKDLAKAVAKQCVVFNCSDGLDYKAMGKFFKGIAQAGAWACFDEFNRIEVEVLSVIAQQILSIQMAISMKMEKFMFEGTELKLNPTCNVIITMNPGYAGRQELPDNLKALFRTVVMMVPDYIMIGEITLYSYGFFNAKVLAEKIVHTYKLCSEQLSSQNHYDYGMRAVKTVLIAAGNLKLKYPTQDELTLVLRAIVDVNLPKFLSQDVTLFSNIYMDLFPDVTLSKPDRDELIQQLKENLEKRNLQATEWYLEKIIQIYEMLLVRHGLMLVGTTLGGKTQAYQTLAASLGDLSGRRKSTIREFRTIYRVINPKAITLSQLYGSFDPVSHEWSDGVLANTFREFAQFISVDRKWIVFDGPVDAIWIESMNTVLDDNKKLCLMSGEIIQMSAKMNMFFEVADLEHASPATVSRCGMIYMDPSQLGWSPIFESYKKFLKEKLLIEQFELIVELVEWLTKPILRFIHYSCKTFIDTSENHKFVSFTRVFTMMLAEETRVSTLWLQCVLLFSIVWGMCPTLTNESRKVFDVYLRKLLVGNIEKHPKPKMFKMTKQQLFPDKGTVFDWIYDKRNNGCWISWMDTIKQATLPTTTKASELIIQTTEMCIQLFFIKQFLHQSIPVLFVGPTGTGKSAIVLNYLVSLPREKFLENIINFSARTNAPQTQEIVMSKLDRRRKGVYGPAMGKKYVLFVDDLSMPQVEVYGAQPPIELLRQWVDHGYWFDPKDTSMLYLVDILLIAAMLPSGGSSNVVTTRFTRHMHVIGIDSFEETTMTKIFTSILEWHFAKGFVVEVSRLSKMVVNATLSVFLAAIKTFLPTPSRSHYLFNLRDFSRVISGMLLVPAIRMKDPKKLIRLWIHEVYRVFHDRLINDTDRETLFKIVKYTCYDQLRQPLDKVLERLLKPNEKMVTSSHISDLFFGNYIEPDAEPKIYDEVTDLEDLQEKMDYYLAEYNAISRTPMNLVLFRYAIEHISRISRVLLQDKGHALLIGVDSSGRNSYAKLATSMCEYLIHQIEITKTYEHSEWREDLKNLLLHVGCDDKPTTFIFGDHQIKDESFIEDISMILNTADVPNLYGIEEKAEILDKMSSVVREASGGKKIETTPMMLYNMFIDRIKKNLHIILTMSPIGDAFRNRLRMFPSLINCCTIDWFIPWPEDALEKVARMSLRDLDIDTKLQEKCVQICKEFHMSVSLTSEDYYLTHGRRYYVTPTSFLQLIKSLYKLYAQKTEQITLQQTRYETGLEKLDFAAGQVAVMQEELQRLQPKLVEQSQLSDKLMIRIEQDTVNVEAKKEIVAADEALANEAAAAAQAIKDDCESDLAEATPALEAALAALDTLKPADITIVKAMKSPPAGVRLVMEAICVLKGIKPEKVQDPITGQIVDDYWPASIKMLGDIKFLENLKNFDKDNIPQAYMKRIRDKFINDRSFQPEAIKKVSTACEGLCKWVRAMEVYDRVIKVVAPKKAMLAEAEAALAIQMEMLTDKRNLLQEVSQKLQSLNDEFAECMREKKKLEDQIDYCTQKLERAEKLLSGLGGEKTRWSEIATTLGISLDNVIGDVLLSSGIIAYLGAFTIEYRSKLINQWHVSCVKAAIPCAAKFSLVDILGEPVEIREWTIYGLPADNFSIENGIIVKHADRWPLMIDPQNQANKWIKNMEKPNKLTVIKLTDPNYARVMENAIQLGLPVLLENILEEIDVILEPVLLKRVYKQRGVLYIKFGETLLEYNTNFRFYITTRLRNPHYLPEIVVKVTLLNFMITPKGLQDQLLGIVVAKELPVLEEKKNQLIVEGANNKRILKEIEDKILEVLTTSEGNILEDETAIKILSTSKVLSEDIESKQEIAIKTIAEIDEARNGYVPVSKHGAVLFFCISELAKLDPMYQYSLSWFIHLYIMAIAYSEHSDNLNTRMNNLNSYFTASIYRNVCRSLFEKDKLIFSLVLCIDLLRADYKLEEELWVFFLTGGIVLDNPHPNPDSSWLTDKSWSDVVRANLLPGLEKLRESFQSNISQWKQYYDLSNPQEHPFPPPFENVGESLRKLVILRCVRPDKLVAAVQKFIIHHMGISFVEPPPFDLQSSYDDSSNVTPLIFVLSPGSDPMVNLIKFAEECGISKKNLVTISLGQGQGPVAISMIDRGIKLGEWVILQNCHLAVSWMKELDRICDEIIVPEKTHPKFRIWLTSYPSKEFPVSILQNGIKMTNEPPKGLKNNLLRSYVHDPISNPYFFRECVKIIEWRSLLFSLCFFHAVVLERRSFGPLGWNIPYEFNETDLHISIMQLQLFLNDYDEVPFDALLYLTGECNYGGRVTDDKDRRLLNVLLKKFYNFDVITRSRYSFSPSGIYHMPEDTSYEGCLAYIRSLPLTQLPEVFGFHDNADISKDNREAMQLLSATLLTQPQISKVGVEKDTDEVVYTMADDIFSKMPPLFDIEYVSDKYPILYMNSMNTVLRQELVRFNELVEIIMETLINVRKAIRGQVLMSAELEEIYSFLTAVLQNHARKHKIPIDQLDFEFEMTGFEMKENVDVAPLHGVYISGLFLEGARWNRNMRMLDESKPKVIFDVLPIIWLKPDIKTQFEIKNVYYCPVYKTSARRGVLATTGHSSNFILYILMPTNVDESHWIIRGVAALCQLDN
ncbi:dynein heavy chain 3, axonemal isoform X2 [Pseudomyrmex gracilis]|uniref:dynein heavy chain 3, axonemal isoform X2 n=1 Tax=Pseudomyrmex gracilis TaxID=219809 RepID=UPI000995C70A|nr:dynein heavy chain 3, axonemal isoform X2 [Pseudomyrmex gracilis]